MKIKKQIFEIPGAPIEGVNPLPALRDRKPVYIKCDESFPEELKKNGARCSKVLPYLTQDRYSRRRDNLKLKSVVLENEYLKAIFLPELGGRLHSLFDKKLNKELLFSNPVIQPGNLAIRNAWLSGGIEWNIGNFGHHYLTCDNVYAAVLNDREGNDFLRIYEFERNKSIFWQIDFHLPDNSPQLMAYVRMINPFSKNTTTYYWTNIAVPSTNNTRVIASNRNVISFAEGKCLYERLPYLAIRPDLDATYPCNAPNAYDYFIQKDKDGESTWEAAAYGDGSVFYERSTAPLYYKKLFVWGNHRGGDHWQEFLSAGEGYGYYAEIQAGIAPSQLHDKLFPANSTYEWIQCFGGVKLEKEKLHDKDYDSACAYFDSKLSEMLSKEDIEKLEKRAKRLADTRVKAENIVHRGSGFGALEIMRMEKDNDGVAPDTMCFPEDSIGKAEEMWLELLNEGILKERPTDNIPDSYMVSLKWKPRIKESLEKEAGNNWLGLLHNGIIAYEAHNTEVTAEFSYNEEEDRLAIDEARTLWKKSIEKKPNIWAYRNLAVLEEKEGNLELTEKYYDAALSLPEAFVDFALASEYLRFLLKEKKYEKTWSIFGALPESCKKIDRIRISAAQAAVKLDKFEYLENFFNEEHYDIREGEVSLTDVWFEFCAKKMARASGITELSEEKLSELIEQASEKFPPNKEIDFRMSLSKKTKYRI